MSRSTHTPNPGFHPPGPADGDAADTQVMQVPPDMVEPTRIAALPPAPRRRPAATPPVGGASVAPAGRKAFVCAPTILAPLPDPLPLPAPPEELAHGSIVDGDIPDFRHGQYRVVAPLGHGAMGAVYRGEHGHLSRPVALKVLHPRFRRDREAQARFLAEAVATSRVQHPNVVTIYDFGHGDGGTPYLAMELLTGDSLATLLARERSLSIGRAVAIARQIASGLAAVHAAGIVHRDLKPENLFVTRDPLDPDRDLVKLLDFGVCKLDASPSPNVTGHGNLLGTPHYMAPEQGKNARLADPRSDVYALGCVLYEMLCGHLPFTGALIDVLMAHQHRAPEPPRRLNPEVPPALDALVLAMLAKDPADRPRNMGEVERRLAEVDPSHRFAAMPASVPRAPSHAELELHAHALALRTRRGTPRVGLWLAAAAVAGAAALAVTLLMG